MKNAIRYTVLIILLPLFLGASGGVFFIVHHCQSHHESSLRFFQHEEGACCDHEGTSCCDTDESSCCANLPAGEEAVHPVQHDCCLDEPVFLKLDLQYLPAPASEKMVVLLNSLPSCAILPQFSFQDIIPLSRVIWPPGAGLTQGFTTLLSPLRI